MSTNRDSIRIKRGMSAELPESLPLGELAFCIDTRELWVGSGDGLPLKRVTNTEITQHLEEWNLLYTEVNERFETKYHDVSSQFAEKFLDLSEQFSDKYQDLNKQFSDKFEEICVQFSTKYDNLEEHYAKDLLANKLLSQANKESIDLLKRDIGTTENIEDLREINNQATETLEQLNAVKEELQNDVLVIKDIEKDLQKASVDYSGEHHENLKDSMDANVDFILGEFNSTNMTGEHITAHNTIQRHIKNAELKGHTEVNYIKDPSDKDLVMPYPFDDAQSIKLSDTKDTGSLNIVLKGNTEVNVLKNPMRDYVVPYEFEEGYTATLTDTKETGSIQSAILKGQTLVNVINYDDVSLKNATRNDDGTYTLKHAQDVNTSFVIPKTTTKNLFKPNTKYLLAVNIIENNTGTVLGLSGINSPFPVSTNSQRNFEDKLGWQFKTFTTNSDITVDDSGRPVYNYMYFGIWKDGGDLSTSIKFKFMLIEYQDGMENWDIPYFEGMQSVKMPVLTTTGKNLFDGKIENGSISSSGSNDGNVTNRHRSINYIRVKPNTQYVYSANIGETSCNWIWYDKDKKFISRPYKKTAVSPSNAYYLRYFSGIPNDTDLTKLQVQIEEGSTATSYEPHKSNILTVNEEVELRGIGDVKDTLDCLTGEIVSNFSTYSFSDVDNWRTNTEANCQRFTLRISPSPIGSDYSDKVCIISDKLPGVKWNQSWNTVNTISCSGDSIAVQLPLGTTIEQFKELMRGSKIVYRIKSSIKTVDLSILDQDGLSVPALSTYNEVTHIDTTVPENSLKPLISSKTPEFPVMIKPNTKYSIVADTTTNGFDEIPLTYNLGGAEVETSVGEKLTVIQTPSTLENETFKVTGTGMKLSNVMILEKDLTGKELPDYFEGMKSVKNPVLTTTGKNLADINNSTTNNIDKIYIPCYLVKGNNYTITTNVDYSGRLISIQTINDEEVQIISNWGANNKQFTFNGETGKYLILIWKGSLISEYPNIQVQLEQGLTETSYEPYKSNLLSCNEEVTLRGIGNIKDELNVATGELTQRIKEVVLDGSDDEVWSFGEMKGDNYRFGLSLKTDVYGSGDRTPILSDKFAVGNLQTELTQEQVMIYNHTAFMELRLTISPKKLTSNTGQALKDYLKANPFTIQYALGTPVVKTVDFTIKNQNNQPVSKLSTYNEVTHIDTSVEDVIKPTISHRDLEYNVLIKPNTKYSIITNPMTNDHNRNPISFDLGGTKVSQSLENHCTVITTPQTLTHEKLIFSEGVGHKLQGGVMVLEGDKTGMMLNHFDGMKSVENPTVRVNNENLWNIDMNKYSGLNGINPNGFVATKNSLEWTSYSTQYSPSVWYHLKLKPNKQYVLSFDERTPHSEIIISSGHIGGTFDASKVLASNINGYLRFTPKSEKITIRFANNGYPNGYSEPIKVANPMLVLSDTSKKHIPHQSNSLPLTIPMRSLPDGTCDTLNLLTGEYIQNVKEVVLTGQEDSWFRRLQEDEIPGYEDTLCFYYRTTDMTGATGSQPKVVNPRFIQIDSGYSKTSESISTYWSDVYGNKDIFIRIKKDRLPHGDIVGFKLYLKENNLPVQYPIEPIITYLDLQWEDGKLFAYDGTTHFFVDVEGGHLQPILDVDVPVNIVAELSRLRAEKEQLETSKAQLENQLEVITYRNTNLQSNLDSLVAENQDLKLQTYDLQTRSNVLQLKNKEMTKHQEKLQAENLELQKRASELAQTTMNLTEELHVVDSVRETGDLELLSSDFELDFRLMEIEFALDIPISLSVKGVSSMARTPFEMAKTLILGGKYDREDMEKKLKVYRDRGKITSAEYDELVALMDANELA